MAKFSSMMNARSLGELRRFANSQGRTVASILTEAVDQYLERASVRPAFRKSVDEVLSEHEELLRRLAR